MNFLSGTLEEGKLRTSLGDFPLTDQMRRALTDAKAGPSRSSSASGRRTSRTRRWWRTDNRRHGHHLPHHHRRRRVHGLRRVRLLHPGARDRGDLGRARGAGQGLRARGHRRQRRHDRRPARRRDPRTRGPEAELWVDARAIHVFDPASGRNLSLGNAEEQAATATAPAAPAAPAARRPRRQRPTPRHGRTTSPDLVAQPLDDLVAPLVRQDQAIPLGGDPQVGLRLGAVADQVGWRAACARPAGTPRCTSAGRSRRGRRTGPCPASTGSPTPRRPRRARRTTTGRSR